MSSIEVLEDLLGMHLYNTKHFIDQSGWIEGKTKALTEAIQALKKADQVERISSEVKALKDEITDRYKKSNLNSYRMGQLYALTELLKIIDSITAEDVE